MAKTFETITPALQEWIEQQHVFFVASAPNTPDGHVNCSPKGGDSLRILNDREVAYLDLTGSGAETIAHLQENGRLVIMWCAFEGGPKIVRLHGRGTALLPADAEFDQLRPLFPPHPGTRAIIKLTATRISDSCGYTVPFMDFVKHRDTLDRWSEAKSAEELADYRQKNNTISLDGLPGYPRKD
jgi:hypothetical protein